MRGFAGADAPERWPIPRGVRPERLESPLDTLPGVGPKIASRLRKLGLGSVRDLLEHRPRDYQRAVGESRIADLSAEEARLVTADVGVGLYLTIAAGVAIVVGSILGAAAD